MKRRAKVAVGVMLGAVAIWLLLFSFGLFLLGACIGLGIRLAIVTAQRDETTVELVDAWFTVAALEQRLRRSDVVDVPLYRHGKGTW